MKPNIANQLRDGAVTQSLETIERRVNELGVAEPIVARYGGQDQIVVQLPGVSDVRRAKEIIRSTAQLKLTLVEQGPFPNREAALQAFNNTVPTDVEILPGRQEGGGTAGTAGTVFYAVEEGSGGQRPRPAQCPAVARRIQPAGRWVHARSRMPPPDSGISRRPTSDVPWPSCSTTA